ncbi:hypothetical protein EXW95_18985 [Deinococcus sp. JMULE3]|nr:hypothetical protein [Deinococcus sp. JMULE3]
MFRSVNETNGIRISLPGGALQLCQTPTQDVQQGELCLSRAGQPVLLCTPTLRLAPLLLTPGRCSPRRLVPDARLVQPGPFQRLRPHLQDGHQRRAP